MNRAARVISVLASAKRLRLPLPPNDSRHSMPKAVRKRRALEDEEGEEGAGREEGRSHKCSGMHTAEGARARSLRKLQSAQRHHARAAGVDANTMLKPSEHCNASAASSSATVAGRALADAFQGGKAETSEPEDPLVEQYVQEQLRKRRGADEEHHSRTDDGVGISADEKAKLYQTPRELDSHRHIEEEGPEKHLSGIVEVKLPVEQRMKNVEATERAKAQMLDQEAGLTPSFSSSTARNAPSAASESAAATAAVNDTKARRMLPKSFSKPNKRRKVG